MSAATETIAFLQKFTAERDRLRAELEKVYVLVTPVGFDLPGGIFETAQACTELRAERDQLRAEVERLKTCGIVELAAINSSVLEYCKHWEARAERAEAELKAERAIVSRIWTQLGSPTYEQLRGRSIYDLISELKANATSSAPRWKREREWQAGIIAHAQLHHAERKEAIARAERAEAEVARLRAGIGECLRQNGHLADGEDCTLISLKRCLYNPTDTRESKGVAERDPVQTQ
jgi:hypothetical protein